MYSVGGVEMHKNLSRTERYLRVCEGMIERLVTRCGNGERLVTASSCLVHSRMWSAGFHFLPRQVNAAPSWFSDRSVHVCPYLATFCVAVQVVPWMFKNRVRIYEYKKDHMCQDSESGPGFCQDSTCSPMVFQTKGNGKKQ